MEYCQAMSPRRRDESIRLALVEAAARLIATEGSAGLTLRRVADEVGTSTMAVYTHFGGMHELREEVRREGFARLRSHLSAVQDTGDAIADLIVLGWAYYVNGTMNPNLYRAMFMERPIGDADRDIGLDTFERLVRGVQRAIDAGRFRRAEALDRATELWALAHGVVTLELAGLLDSARALSTFSAASRGLFEAYGDNPQALGRSFTRALTRISDGGQALPDVASST
jgi:AcrR family transcriptional regulator